MAFDLTGAADYAKSNGKIILTDLVLAGQSMEILPVQEGIKSADKLVDFADGGTVLQGGDYTATAYNGGVKLTDKQISVTEIHVKEKYSNRDLNSKIAQMVMKAGSAPDSMPYQDVLVGLKSASISAANEKLLWQGNTAGAGNLIHFDGFLTQVLAAADKTVTGTAAASLTASNAISKVEAIVEKSHVSFPEWIDTTHRLFMAPKEFSTYYRAVNKLSEKQDKMTNTPNVVKEFVVPGTNCIATSIAGLHGSAELIITRPENFVVGVDLKSEDESFKFEYLNEALFWRLFALYKLGCQIARTNEVVSTGVAPV